MEEFVCMNCGCDVEADDVVSDINAGDVFCTEACQDQWYAEEGADT